MTQFSIIPFDGIGVSFALRNSVASKVIPKRSIDIEAITEILFGFGRFIHQGLKERLRPFPSYLPTQNATRGSIYQGNQVNSVFLLPIKVKISSNSAVFT